MSVSLNIDAFGFRGFINQFGPFPLADEDASRGGEVELEDEFTQLVATEAVGQLVVEADLHAVIAVIILVHLFILASPSAEQTIHDVGGHKAVEANHVLLFGGIFAPKIEEETGHAGCGNGSAFEETVART